MKPITSILNFHFKPTDFSELSETERNILIYNGSVKLMDIINYRDLLIQITFLETNNIPDTIQVYCFKSKSPIEKEKTERKKQKAINLLTFLVFLNTIFFHLFKSKNQINY